LFYPLLLPFYGPAILIFLFLQHRNIVKKYSYLVWYASFSLLIGLPLVWIIIMISPLAGSATYIFSRLFYFSYSGNFIPQFSIFYIVPLPILCLSLFGLGFIFKEKKWLLWNLCVGLCYWIIYFFVVYRAS